MTHKLLFSALFCLSISTGQAQDESRIDSILSQLTLEEKVSLCNGDNGKFRGIERLGIPPVYVTDGGRGPNGRVGNVAFPCGLLQASTWNTDLMNRAAQVMGEETKSLGRGMLLAPAVNILRDPLCGRFFEYFAEDPYLNGEMAAAFVQGVQKWGIATCMKHYACNNREHNRNYYYSVLDDRTLHEIYLPVFKRGVEAGLWSIMTSANGVNYEYVSDSRKLQTDILKNKWGFDGFILTDWLQTRSTEKAAFAGLDVSMPGGNGTGYDVALLEAVKAGRVSVGDIDDKVRRILRCYARMGALDGKMTPEGVTYATPEHISVAREVAQEGIVLLKNDNHLLPLDAKKIKNILVTGPNADKLTGGWLMGGSSWIAGPYEVTILKGLQNAFGEDRITYVSSETLADFLPVSGEQLSEFDGARGFRARYYKKNASDPVATVIEPEMMKMWEMKSPVPDVMSADEFGEARIEAYISVPEDGKYTFRFSCGGGKLNGFDDEWGGAPVFSCTNSSTTAQVEITRDKPFHLCMIYYRSSGDAAISVEMMQPESKSKQAVLANLDKAAKRADVVVYAGGLDQNLDTEGRDRSSLSFPQDQLRLINRLASKNKNMLVVLENGSPVELGGWLGNVKSLVEVWYPGMEGGNALADVITGKVNPSGRMTFSWPKRYEDCPKAKYGYEDDIHVVYGDSLRVGYRYYDTEDVEPEFAFGYGLDYTSYEYSDLQVVRQTAGKVECSVKVKNTGKVDGRPVVQLYVRPENPTVWRPVHELKAFHKPLVKVGETETIRFTLGDDAFSYYDVARGDWVVDHCNYQIEIAENSRKVVLSKHLSW